MPTRNMAVGIRFRVWSGEWRYDTFEHQSETEEAHTGKPKRHRLCTEALRTLYSGSVGNEKKKIFFGDFSKKAENHFKKSRKLKKKKRNFAEKWKTDIPATYIAYLELAVSLHPHLHIYGLLGACCQSPPPTYMTNLELAVSPHPQPHIYGQLGACCQSPPPPPTYMAYLELAVSPHPPHIWPTWSLLSVPTPNPTYMANLELAVSPHPHPPHIWPTWSLLSVPTPTSTYMAYLELAVSPHPHPWVCFFFLPFTSHWFEFHLKVILISTKLSEDLFLCRQWLCCGSASAVSYSYHIVPSRLQRAR